MKNIKLVVWHKTEKAKYDVLAIDWNTATVSLIRRPEESFNAAERLCYESIDSVVLAEIIFID